MTLTVSNSVSLIKVTLTGIAGPGPISVPGLLKGDILTNAKQPGYDGGFEDIVSVDGQIQQTIALDWSTVELTFYFLRGVFS